MGFLQTSFGFFKQTAFHVHHAQIVHSLRIVRIQLQYSLVTLTTIYVRTLIRHRFAHVYTANNKHLRSQPHRDLWCCWCKCLRAISEPWRDPDETWRAGWETGLPAGACGRRLTGEPDWTMPPWSLPWWGQPAGTNVPPPARRPRPWPTCPGWKTPVRSSGPETNTQHTNYVLIVRRRKSRDIRSTRVSAVFSRRVSSSSPGPALGAVSPSWAAPVRGPDRIPELCPDKPAPANVYPVLKVPHPAAKKKKNIEYIALFTRRYRFERLLDGARTNVIIYIRVVGVVK